MTDWQNTILNWYNSHRRDLPWRNISDPYKIWVSEIILQQTRVAQGHAYYDRFITAFPSVEALANATEDEVLRLWQGLGYYSRARNMRLAAQQIIDSGGFPTSYKGVRALRGVGDYTAAAICSFAYGMPYAVVDGNVYRVLARYFGIEKPIDTGEGKRYFAQLATELLPHSCPGDYNQALMDFGAMQCVPSSPDCDACPFECACVARTAHCVAEFPVKQHRTKVKQRYFVYLLVDTPDGIWLHRRDKGDIWQGLYELPLLELAKKPLMEDVMQHPFVQNLPKGYTLKKMANGVKHVLTHQCIIADCYAFTYTNAIPCPPSLITVLKQDITHYALPRLVEKMLLF